jgi:hypothetical protein
MGKMKSHTTLTTLFLVALAVGAGAQSARNFQPPAQETDGSPSHDLAQKVQIAELDKETESALMASPSRYAGLDVDQYVHALSSSFSMRTRDIDPFARHQDPDFKPIKPKRTLTRGSKPNKPEPVTPFSDIVARVNITAVMAAQQTFLIGSRSFTIGDRINLDIGKGKPLAIHVVGIRKNRVTFRHSITHETADRALSITPFGMVPGNVIRPPGIESERDATVDARPTTTITSSR